MSEQIVDTHAEAMEIPEAAETTTDQEVEQQEEEAATPVVAEEEEEGDEEEQDEEQAAEAAPVQLPVAQDSRTVSEFAAAHLQTLNLGGVADELIQSWNNIGESDATQKTYIQDLYAGVRTMLDNAVAASNQRRVDIENLISRKTENIATLKADLEGAVDFASDAAFAMPGPERSLIQTLNDLENIEVKLITVRQQWEDRISAKLTEVANMCEHLGMEVDAKFAEVGSLDPERLAAVEAHIEFLEQTQAERKQIIADGVASIMEYWKVLESTPATHLEKSIADPACDLGVHIEVIEALQQMKADLDVEYQNREAETAELGAEIQHLWDLLQIDPAFQQYFSEKNGGIGLRAVEACRDERQRLLIKKDKLMPRIIQIERQKIQQLFEQTSCDMDNQKKLFGAFHEAPEVQDEEYLNVLKSYTAKLEKRSEALQPILGRIERRQALVEERAKYEAMIADPNRLTSRGRGLSQLKENEMRIRVEKKLPKLEAALSEMVSKWEAENEATLIFNGVKFLETMTQECEEYAARKEEERNSHKEALKTKKEAENAPPAAWKRTKRRVGGRTQKLNRTGGSENRA